MYIIFRDKYVHYNQLPSIGNIPLIKINDLLLFDDINLELGDDGCNEWAGFCYYYCKYNFNIVFDDKTLSSFISVITWFMTGESVEIYSDFISDDYFRNGQIVSHCYKIYNQLLDRYEYENIVDFCEDFFIHVYDFYTRYSEKFIKRDKRLNCLITYKNLQLFNKVEGKSCGDKLEKLLDSYFSTIDLF